MPKSNTLFPWPGGKTRLLQHLLPLLSANPHRTYVEAFSGGAAVLFNHPAPAKIEVLNDTHGELVRLYRVVANHLDEFVRQFRWMLTSRDEFERLKRLPPDTLTDIQRAVRFFFLQKTAFGGKVSGQTWGAGPTAVKSINLLRLEEDLSAAHLRLHRVAIENLTWQACMAKYDTPETLFFLDPPYWQTEGYGEGFGLEQYEQLADVMANLKGVAILTINDHPVMRNLFDRFGGKTVGIDYTIGKGRAARKERIYVAKPKRQGGKR